MDSQAITSARFRSVTNVFTENKSQMNSNNLLKVTEKKKY